MKIKTHGTTILPVVVYGCWSVTPRVKNEPSTFEVRVLRKILEPKRDEVAEESRRLHKEEFRDLNFSPNIIR
jgi:hypothetical protein